MSVDNVGGSSSTGQYTLADLQAALSDALEKFSFDDTTLPSTTGSTANSNTSSTGSADDVPDLDTPRVSSSSGFSGLSIESLVAAIGNTERKQACAEGVDRLERRAEKISENNQLRLEELAKNLEVMKQQETLSPFQKAFQWIGAIVGTIASAATIAVGVMTANPLLITAGVIGAVMAVDGIVSLATDGEVSISAGIAKAAEELGASEDAAQWIAFGVQMAITLTAVGLSFGAAGASLGSSAMNISTSTLSTLNKVQAGLQMVSGLNTIASGATTIASTIFSYQAAEIEATVVDIQAILDKIKMAQEFEEAMIKAEMERSNDLLTTVDDIVDEANATAMTIMGSSPSMV